MSARQRRHEMRPLALTAGGAVGAVLRYALSTTWPLPHQVLISTVATVGFAFLIATFVLASGATSTLHAVVLGLCGSAASLSAWAVLTIDAPMRLSLAFLVVTPAMAVVGVLCGLVMARALAR
ncbi:chromosome condensation protein CrcB [Mycolicibacterium sp. BiH015]|uniref:chromosome condensation protein CrcB n=1 Tax=Mycolicibacterium sp. BiH015 TaxID=3018808 RepID=UPI0022DEFBF2|nr:chromosome condensation protein CrcB [Mycolicibacterium sp. BiH015]MDA2895452.1 chromosome condensation protein CrcB [Mycolicibacterium sp. BiH015]